MPQFFVRQPNGKLAVFSTIVDSFVVSDMTVEEAVGHAMNRLRLTSQDAREKVDRGINDSPIWGDEPGRADKLFRWKDSLDTIMRVHGLEHIRDIMKEAGLDPNAPENQPSPGLVQWPETNENTP